MLRRAQTENEILRASCRPGSPRTPHLAPQSFMENPGLLSHSMPQPIPQSHNDRLYDSVRLANGLLSTESPTSNYGSLSSTSDSHLLSASAAWDLLQSHPLYLSGGVDIGEVCDRLKKMARSDGMGPMFEELEVRRLIDEVGGRNSVDELI